MHRYEQSLLSSNSQISSRKEPILNIPQILRPNMYQKQIYLKKFKIYIEVVAQLYLTFILYLIVCSLNREDLSHRIFKAIGCAVGAIVAVRIYVILGNELFKDTEVIRRKSQSGLVIAGFLLMLAGFLIFTGIDLFAEDYHYILCGTNTLTLVYCVYICIQQKYPLSIGTLAYMIYLVIYYILRRCQLASQAQLYTSDYSGLVSLLISIVILVISVFFGLGTVDGQKYYERYHGSFFLPKKNLWMIIMAIGLYFGLLILVAIYNKDIPFWIISTFVHVYFVIFVLGCIPHYIQLTSKPLLLLQSVQKNILKPIEELPKQKRPQKSSYEQCRLHMCKICKPTKNDVVLYSIFAQQCINETYHLFMCDKKQCIQKWLNLKQNRGKCSRCRERKNKIWIVKYVQQYGVWEGLLEMDVNLSN